MLDAVIQTPQSPIQPGTVSTAPADLLVIDNLRGWYGESQALHGINLNVRRGETVTLLGRNGAGKTSTLRSIMGLLARREGSVKFSGSELIAASPDQIARRGIGYCPEERGIFAGLTVQENLVLPPIIKAGGMTLAEIHQLFPNLAERSTSPGTKLSGGEQQMLAIARILRTGADLLLLDEPTEGLAPVIIEQIGHAINKLKERGFTIILVEQNFNFAASVSERFYVIEDGRVVDHIAAAEVADPATVANIHSYLSI
ncbi:ABC transporter ATP-binding protein [Glaciimonas immobilis]|uniref:Branched-chain amino acid transport system ATP-binding protein n=1 Tax=Glaciimonas immobilis TaxID=728004 RepID=A0A840RVJ8_9BURK|nr:ABC transporter ATP-binding protein [Glaciimonas immobilis]KAF3996452.1 ABC transporter ATP-binding protein [Glaciimonas immobilis]MBB5201202.1 branched-chain amino acid transport system ATP-binding protein [Glaciimonas immobilis]